MNETGSELEASIRRQTKLLEELKRDFLFWEYQSMKIVYTTPNGRLRFELEVATGKQAFEVVGNIQELFEEPECGCCKSKNIRFSKRTVKENDYYNLRCADCNAQLDIGQRKDGKGMWVKRTSQEGGLLPNRGWYVWQQNSNKGNDEQHQRAPTDQQYNQQTGPGDDIPF